MDENATRAVEIGDGMALHVRLSGREDGRTLVLINSLGSDMRIWDGVLPYLAARYRVVRFDKRGHGLSDTPPGPYTMAGLAHDVAGLLDALAIGPAVVMGISIGGMIAQNLASLRPDLVEGLVLMDTGARIGDAASWDERIRAIEAGGIAAMADGIIERWLPAAYRRARPAELSIWRNTLTRTPLAGYLGACAAIRDADLTTETSTITVPALCLVGENDQATPLMLMESLAELLVHSRLVVLPGSGHLPCIDQPERVAREVLGYLEEHGLG